MNFNSPRIYITSPYEPAEMYKGKEDLTQLMRRIDTLIVYKGDKEVEIEPRKEFEENKQTTQRKKYKMTYKEYQSIKEELINQEEDEYYTNYDQDLY